MRSWIAFAFVLCLLFSGCSDRAKNEKESVQITKENEPYPLVEPVVLKTPIVHTFKHFFSDPEVMDSFVVKIDSGLVNKSEIFIEVYTGTGDLIYRDSISPLTYMDYSAYREGTSDTAAALDSLRTGIKQLIARFDFTRINNDEALQNAGATQIINMNVYNELEADTNKVIFSFFNRYLGTYQVAYSQKMKQAVMIMHVENGGIN